MFTDKEYKTTITRVVFTCVSFIFNSVSRIQILPCCIPLILYTEAILKINVHAAYPIFNQSLLVLSEIKEE